MIAGALLLVVCSAMALGIVSVPQVLGSGPDPDSPGPVAGSPGLYPGGPAQSVPVTFTNPGDSWVEITAVQAGLAALPAACPWPAWQVTTPGHLPTVAAGTQATVILPVALADDAPATCQGLTVRFPVRIEGHRRTPSGQTPSGQTPSAEGQPVTLSSEVQVVTAVLGTPSARVAVRDGQVWVEPVKPAAGPAPAEYLVRIPDTGSGGVLCARATGSCPDRTAPAAAARRYLVNARLGQRWTRDSAPVTGWTPPPVPEVALSPGQAGASSAGLVLRAAPAASGYQVALLADDATAPFRIEPIEAGDAGEHRIALPALGAGRHRIVAEARFRDWRVPSAALQLTLSAARPGSGASGLSAVQGPAADPAAPLPADLPVAGWPKPRTPQPPAPAPAPDGSLAASPRSAPGPQAVPPGVDAPVIPPRTTAPQAPAAVGVQMVDPAAAVKRSATR